MRVQKRVRRPHPRTVVGKHTLVERYIKNERTRRFDGLDTEASESFDCESKATARLGGGEVA